MEAVGARTRAAGRRTRLPAASTEERSVRRRWARSLVVCQGLRGAGRREGHHIRARLCNPGRTGRACRRWGGRGAAGRGVVPGPGVDGGSPWARARLPPAKAGSSSPGVSSAGQRAAIPRLRPWFEPSPVALEEVAVLAASLPISFPLPLYLARSQKVSQEL